MSARGLAINILFYFFKPVNNCNCLVNYKIKLSFQVPSSARQDFNLSRALPRADTILFKPDLDFFRHYFLIYHYD